MSDSLQCCDLLATRILSMKFLRQEYWSGLPCPSPGDLPDPGIEPMSPALAVRFFTTEPPGKLLLFLWFSLLRAQGAVLLIRETSSGLMTWLFYLVAEDTQVGKDLGPWLRWERICLQCRRLGFNPWVRKIPCRREWQPAPVFLPGESHGQRSLVSYCPWGHKESDTTEPLTLSNSCGLKSGKVPD